MGAPGRLPAIGRPADGCRCGPGRLRAAVSLSPSRPHQEFAIARTAHRIRWGLLVLAGVVVLLVAYTGYQAIRAKDALQRVSADFQELRSQLVDGDTTGAASTLRVAQDDAQQARHDTHGPGWWLVGKVPSLGANVSAVQTVADVSDGLAADVLPDVVRAAKVLQPDRLRPKDGRIDLAPIRQVAPYVVRADRRLQRDMARLQAVDTHDLAGQIAAPVRRLQDGLASAAALSDRASRAVRLLPPMLGADGKQTYLFLFQNNAEVRATGGIPGSFAVVTADHGQLTMGHQGDAGTIGRFDHPVLPLTSAEKSLFGENLGRYPQDVNLSPDFPRTGQLITAMWNARHRAKVDGVVSVDPVALSYLLGGTGPVHIAGGRQLTASNAVPLLLNRIYFQIADPSQQNLFLNSVARSVFDAFTAGQGQPREVLQQLTKAADERRILVWSRHPSEQQLLGPTAMGGRLRQIPSVSPDLGLFLDDASGGKMDYYLHYRVDVASDSCHGSRQQLGVVMRMRSSVPADTRGLPDYVFRPVVRGPRGTFVTTMYLYLPVGGRMSQVTIDGADQPFSVAHHDGRTVVAETVRLTPGQRHTLRFRLSGGLHQVGDPVLQVTPGANGPGVGRVDPSVCRTTLGG